MGRRPIVALLVVALVSASLGFALGAQTHRSTRAAGPWRIELVALPPDAAGWDEALLPVNDFFAALDPGCEVQTQQPGQVSGILVTYRC